MNALDKYIYCGRAMMMGDKKLLDVFENNPELGTAIAAGRWNEPGRKIVNPEARILILCYGGGDSGSVEEISVVDDPEKEDRQVFHCGTDWGIYDGPQHETFYNMLKCQEYDWWNNEGGDVEIVLNPANGEIEKTYNLNITTQESHVSDGQIPLQRFLSSVQEIGKTYDGHSETRKDVIL